MIYLKCEVFHQMQKQEGTSGEEISIAVTLDVHVALSNVQENKKTLSKSAVTDVTSLLVCV